jgi:hypothetical protein
MMNGYKTDLVMFSQISGTMHKKWHVKRTSEALRNGPTTSPAQRLLCLKLALAWLLLSISALNALKSYPHGLKLALVK